MTLADEFHGMARKVKEAKINKVATLLAQKLIELAREHAKDGEFVMKFYYSYGQYSDSELNATITILAKDGFNGRLGNQEDRDVYNGYTAKYFLEINWEK